MKSLFYIGIIFSILMLPMLGAAEELGSEEDHLNFIARAYVDYYAYDARINELNGSVQDAPNVDIDDFSIALDAEHNISAKTTDPEAGIAVKDGSCITITDNSTYKYLYDVAIAYEDVEPYILENNTVMMSHHDENDSIDATWYQHVENVSGYAVFEALPFTTVTVGYNYLNISVSGTVQAGYQINFKLPYKTGMSSDFANIRFYTGNTSYYGGSAAQYWIENYTASDNANVWVPIPVGTQKVYCQWGMTGETVSESSGKLVFPALFDDFGESSLNTTLWETGYGNVTLTDGIMTLAPTTYSYAYVGALESYDASQYTLRERINGNTSLIRLGGYASDGSVNSISNCIYSSVRNNSTAISGYVKNISTATITLSPMITQNGFIVAEFRKATDGTNYWNVVNSTYSTTSGSSTLYSSTSTTMYPVFVLNSASYKQYADWVLLRKYNASVPTITIDGTVVSVPQASLSVNTTSGVSPKTIQFTDLSTGNVTSWLWDFGDGQTSTSRNVTHTYNSAGTYTVSLTVNNGAGYSTDTENDYITISQPAPIAGFSGNVTSGNVPFTVHFTDSSTNTPTSWAWSFGDGTSNSTSQNPNHTYTVAGTYTVTLTATNSGGSNTYSRTNYITALQAKPVASFTGTPTSGNIPFTVTFTDASTNSPTSWNWNFGDGSANSTSQNPTHQYTTAGTYTVVLTASNAGGSGSYSRSNYITALPAIPVAAFSANVTSGGVPLTVHFTDNSIGANSWSWNFGDGQTSASQNPNHTYNSVGTYTVTLTATNAGGSDGETKTGYISVSKSTPAITWSNPAAIENGTALSGVQLNTVASTPGSFVYTPAIGTVLSVGTTTLHVDFTPTDATNYNSASADVQIVVYLPPSSSFASEGTTLLNVQFSDNSTNATSWYWDFGDGTNSTEQHPEHTYSAEGQYTVTLISSSDFGSNTTTQTVDVMLHAPRNYGQYVKKVFRPNMTSWDFLGGISSVYRDSTGDGIFYLILWLIPMISMWNRQGSTVILSILYLFTGSFVAIVLPAYWGGALMWMMVLGAAGVIYRIFIPEN